MKTEIERIKNLYKDKNYEVADKELENLVTRAFKGGIIKRLNRATKTKPKTAPGEL